MLRLINNLQPHVIGIHAFDAVTEQEYVTLLNSLMDEALKKNRKINLIVVLEADIANFASGIWCGTVRIGLRHFFRWRKVAIVSDRRNPGGYSDFFRYIIPGTFKTFPLIKMDEAIIWASKK